jgi:carboxypeptidase C (cathepsin A)
MNKPWAWLAFTGSAALLALGSGVRAADETPAPKPAAAPPAPARAGSKAEAKEAEPAPIVTEHTLMIGGQLIKYRATVGFYYLPDDPPKAWALDSDTAGLDAAPAGPGAVASPNLPEDQPKAKIFYIAYTREGLGDVAKRPITFAFNGGPGSASIWLHMGALGPRRVHLTDRGEAPPPPYTLEDNGSSWLDATDLVFIDPMSTGFSRPAAGVSAHDYYGYPEDLASVANFVRLYTTRNGRWASPKLIAGESYGTTRAAGLSDYLQSRYGLYMNGIVLISSVLNFETISFARGNDAAYSLFLPSYAAVAWYHHKLPADLQAKPLADVLTEAESFANGDYLSALGRGDALPAADKDRAAAELARLTGLSAAYIVQLNLRVPDALFFSELLKDDNRSVGRYDGRFKGLRYMPGTDGAEFDPSYEAVRPPFTGAFNDYVRRELKFESDLSYEALTPVQPWAFQANRYLDVAETLRRAMTRNPYLKVWICCGYFDLATPYFAAKATADRMFLDPAVRPNLTLTYYQAGHMVYIDKPSLAKLKGDFRTFLQSAVTNNGPAVGAAAP